MQLTSKNLLLKAIRIRVENKEGTAEEIVNTYTKLTDAEKQEILSCITGGSV